MTQVTLRILGRSAKVSKKNGLWSLGSQVAFTVPLNFCWLVQSFCIDQSGFSPLLVIFAFVGRAIVLKEEKAAE